jgi:phosphate transport system substrate-binding protein
MPPCDLDVTPFTVWSPDRHRMVWRFDRGACNRGAMNTSRKTVAGVAALLVVALAVAGCGGSSTSTSTTSAAGGLVGAGSTLVAPLVGAWQEDYQKSHGVTITYGAIGSGGGIAQITARTVDFAGSDAALTPDQKAACKDCVMVPWALAATTVAYDLPGVAGHLKLTGPVLADIYLGTITTWNDPRIAALNPGVTLPSTEIAVVYRSDSSGDTFAFTDYLSKVSSAWRTKEGGASTAVAWPTGTGAKGNAGVAAQIAQTPGAIGYVAIAQTMASDLSYALIGNRAGNYPDPGPKSIAAAAAAATFAPDNSTSLADPPASAPNAYPISTFTYAIVPKGSSKLAALKTFLAYAVKHGQTFATALSFAPLPQSVVAKDRSIVQGL